MEGLSELRFKESDRYRAIINGLNKAGVTAVGYKDSIKIIGKKSIKGGCTINAENDHRIAMSFNILSLLSEKPILVKGNRSICTSFPSFFDTLKSLGVASSFRKIRPIITVDGPAASGKGTISSTLAKDFNLFI